MDAQRMAHTTMEASKLAAHRKTVELLEGHLTEASNLFGGRAIVSSVLSALTAIHEHASSRESVPLSRHNRDKLLGLVMGARENILELVSEDHGKSQVVLAASSIDAACALLICWCDQKQFERPAAFVSEMRDRVRYLRNIFDNLVLQDGFAPSAERPTVSAAHPNTMGRCYG
jgi:hypothetical protein